jgi:RNA recognition motif-containing protein
VSSAVVISDRETGRSRGFGFVEMETEKAAQSAMQALNGASIGGRNVVVNLARDRPQGGPGGGGGGGYGGRPHRLGPPRG